MAFFSKNRQSFPSNKGGQNSIYVRRPDSLSSQSPSQKPASSKIAPTRPFFPKPVTPRPQKSVPQKSKTLFEQKKDWQRQGFISSVAQKPLNMRGKSYSLYERKKILEKTFSPGRFSTYISEGEAKTRLRELRKEEYRAKTGVEKSKISNVRKYIEKQTGLQGKY